MQGADKKLVDEQIQKAHEADSKATSTYLSRLEIIKKKHGKKHS